MPAHRINLVANAHNNSTLNKTKEIVMERKPNSGVICDVKSCRYNSNGRICEIEKIKITSDPSDKHYCHSFESR